MDKKNTLADFLPSCQQLKSYTSLEKKISIVGLKDGHRTVFSSHCSVIVLLMKFVHNSDLFELEPGV